MKWGTQLDCCLQPPACKAEFGITFGDVRVVTSWLQHTVNNAQHGEQRAIYEKFASNM